MPEVLEACLAREKNEAFDYTRHHFPTLSVQAGRHLVMDLHAVVHDRLLEAREIVQIGCTLEHLGVLKVDWYAEVRDGIKDSANTPKPGQREPKAGALLHQSPAAYKRLVDPYDTTENLNLRARSWLHANCSQCHVEAGGGNARMELEFARKSELDKIIKANNWDQPNR